MSISGYQQRNGGGVLRIADMADGKPDASRGRPDLAKRATPFSATEDEARRDGDVGGAVQSICEAQRGAVRFLIAYLDDRSAACVFESDRVVSCRRYPSGHSECERNVRSQCVLGVSDGPQGQ